MREGEDEYMRVNGVLTEVSLLTRYSDSEGDHSLNEGLSRK